jgi:hypothetical protein
MVKYLPSMCKAPGSITQYWEKTLSKLMLDGDKKRAHSAPQISFIFIFLYWLMSHSRHQIFGFSFRAWKGQAPIESQVNTQTIY